MKIEDGRTSFYQWDLGQRLIIEGYLAGTEVHFALKPRSVFDAICYGQQTASVVESYAEGGKIYADVPNVLLQTAGELLIYIYTENGDEAHTAKRSTIDIAPRPKPADYIYTETEIKRWEELDARIAALEAGGSGTSGGTGAPGKDGISPTIEVSKSGKITTLTITDAKGVKTATIHDGADGKDGAPYTLTAEDKANIQAYIDESLGVIENGTY